MYHIKQIGSIIADETGTVININKDYRKALKYLESFSHIHIFYAYKIGDENYLNKSIVKIDSCNERKGVIKSQNKFVMLNKEIYKEDKESWSWLSVVRTEHINTIWRRSIAS